MLMYFRNIYKIRIPILLFFFITNLIGYFLFNQWFLVLKSLGFLNLSFLLFFSILFFNRSFSANYSFNKKIILLLVLLIMVSSVLTFDMDRIAAWHDPGWYLWFAWQIIKNNSFNLFDENLATFPQYYYANEKLAFQTKNFWPFLISSYVVNLPDSLYFYGFSLVNLAFIFIFLNALYDIFDLFYVSFSRRLLFLILFNLSYFTLYFTSGGYVENLLLWCVWISIYALLSLYFSVFSYWIILLGLLSSIFIFLARPEGILYVIAFSFILFYYLYSYFNLNIKFSVSKNKIIWSLGLIIIFFICIYILYIFPLDNSAEISAQISHTKPFYEQAIDFLNNVIKNGNLYSGSNKYDFNPSFLIPLFVVLGHFWAWSFFAFYFLKRNVLPSKAIIIISIFLVPQFFFLFIPSIQPYLPWAFRRYWSWLMVFGYLIIALSNRLPGLKKFLFMIVFLINIWWASLIYPKFLSSGYMDTLNEIVKNRHNPIVFLGNWFEVYASVLQDHFNSKDIIIDRFPMKDKDVYSYFLSNTDFTLITNLSQNSLESVLIKNGLSIKSDFIFLSPPQSFLFRTYPLGNFCHITKYFWSVPYISLNNSFEDCFFPKVWIVPKNTLLYIYEIKSNLAFKDINLRSLERSQIRM